MSYRLGFIMEQTLGHRTISENLASCVAENPEVVATFLPIEYENPAGKIPVVGRNYSVRASLHARKLATQAHRATPFDGFLFHTQVTSLFSNRLMRAVPSVISLDATPLNYDSVGAGYNHTSNPGSLAERIKLAINQRAFHVAKRLVISNHWGKKSLVEDYGIADEKVDVIDPGVNLSLWAGVGDHRSHSKPRSKPHILFVGGDFDRKGGPLLLDVFRRHFRDAAELHLVTSAKIPLEPNIFVYNNFGSNAEGLLQLFDDADLFVLPTLADVSSLASREAMTARLPVIVSAVGAIPELIEEGASGFLIPEGDGDLLRQRIETLIANPSLRRSMGERGREIALDRFDSRKNMQALLDLIKQVARRTEVTL